MVTLDRVLSQREVEFPDQIGELLMLSSQARSMALQNTDFVSSLAKGLAVIRHLVEVKSPQTLSDVADALDMPRATARRLLLTLEELGYAEQIGRQFSLTPQVMRLGYGYFAANPFSVHIDTELKRVSTETGHTSFASIYDKGEITIVARQVGQILESSSTIGTTWPAYCTSMGRVFLSHFSDEEVKTILEETERQQFTPSTLVDTTKILTEVRKVRKTGYSFVENETTVGMRAIAVPVTNQRGEMIASIDVMMIAKSESRKDSIDKALPALKAAAQRLGDIAADAKPVG